MNTRLGLSGLSTKERIFLKASLTEGKKKVFFREEAIRQQQQNIL